MGFGLQIKSELINPDMFVDFLIKMEDVTSVVLVEPIQHLMQKLKSKKILATSLNYQPREPITGQGLTLFYGGNEYYLLFMKDLKMFV